MLAKRLFARHSVFKRYDFFFLLLFFSSSMMIQQITHRPVLNTQCGKYFVQPLSDIALLTILFLFAHMLSMFIANWDNQILDARLMITI